MNETTEQTKTLAFVQGLTCIDIQLPNGLSGYGGNTLEQLQKEYGNEPEPVKLMDLDEFIAHKERALSSDPEEISEERFIEMLEVLPPDNWKHDKFNGVPANAFDLSEHTSGRITSVYVQIGSRYFSYAGLAGQSLDQRCNLVAQSAAFKGKA